MDECNKSLYFYKTRHRAKQVTASPASSALIGIRDLSTDNTINIVFGLLASVIGFLSLVLAWTTWKLMRRRQLSGMDDG